MLMRTQLLLGDEAMERMRKAYVCVVGLGGVGGHCAEAIARAGIGRMLVIDGDRVDVSNINRQLVATKSTVGRLKTEVMCERIRDVSDCRVSGIASFITPENVAEYLPEDLDYIVDAIDIVPSKIALIAYARAKGIHVISAMGAGNRTDPCSFYVTDLFATSGDGLARKMRHDLRKCGVDALDVVCSRQSPCAALQAPRPEPGERQIVGSLSCATAAAGLALAGRVIEVIAGAKKCTES